MNYLEKLKKIILKIPFFIMIFFSVIHLGKFIQWEMNGKTFDLSSLNQITSILYIITIYLWALLVNEKRWIQWVALGTGMMSVVCIGVSAADFGGSINDTLCTGSAILTLLFALENAECLLKIIKKQDKILSCD